MQNTYETAITQVFKDEGGYTNDPRDPGGPTNWGITLEDARHYWKSDATADDVKNMPKSVAEDIYVKHYATPVDYNALPAGVDYSVLDYAINSGISRSIKTLQGVVGTSPDGVIGPLTIDAVHVHKSGEIIDAIYAERLAFLQKLSTWDHFGNGWTARCANGRRLAHSLDLANQVSSKAITTSKPSTTIPLPAPTQVKTQSWLAGILNFILSFIKGK
jgi:lysozyme family protein